MCTVMTSNLPWDKFYLQSRLQHPVQIRFPVYNRQETIQILMQSPPESEVDQDSQFFEGFVQLIYDVFHKLCTDLNEYKYLVSLLFPKYLEPVLDGKGTFYE